MLTMLYRVGEKSSLRMAYIHFCFSASSLGNLETCTFGPLS